MELVKPFTNSKLRFMKLILDLVIEEKSCNPVSTIKKTFLETK